MKPSWEQVYSRLMVLSAVVVHARANPGKAHLKEMSSHWTRKERSTFDAECANHAQALVAKLQELDVWKDASPKEKKFLKSYGSNMDDYEHLAATWRMECVGMLMWALNIVEQWPQLDAEISTDLLQPASIGSLKLPLSLRPEQEIQEKRDLIEFWHWRVRERQMLENHRFYYPPKAAIEETVRTYARKAYQQGKLPEIIEDDFVYLGKPFRNLSADEYAQATSIIIERHFALNWLCGMAPENRWDDTPTDT